ncbi:MAG: hypothetical protein V2J55_11385 [Candidatus Competibacteraceae bacterium]|nr:hypothetical protein [Candidatus Competibacteraceae bacterium]
MNAFGFKATTGVMFSLTALILIAFTPAKVRAADRDFCTSYARQAVRQYDENQRRDCGLKGGRWHSNYDDHYRWCRDNSYDKADKSNRKREEDLRRCRRESNRPDYGRPDYGDPSSDRREFCESYARTAVWQGNENRNKGCGFSGPLWHTDQKSHYKWCLRVSNTEIVEARQRRSRGLSRCGGDPR